MSGIAVIESVALFGSAGKSPEALIDTTAARVNVVTMEPDEPLARRAGDPLDALARHDLDPFSVEELEARIGALTAEIERTQRHLHRAVNHRASADALFKR
ncbi:DUF1192 domain-containing protein [Sphingomonas sp. 28-62-20]